MNKYVYLYEQTACERYLLRRILRPAFHLLSFFFFSLFSESFIRKKGEGADCSQDR